jgi:hypothetical protein
VAEHIPSPLRRFIANEVNNNSFLRRELKVHSFLETDPGTDRSSPAPPTAFNPGWAGYKVADNNAGVSPDSDGNFPTTSGKQATAGKKPRKRIP